MKPRISKEDRDLFDEYKMTDSIHDLDIFEFCSLCEALRRYKNSKIRYKFNTKTHKSTKIILP